jgi:hypothetical protein
MVQNIKVKIGATDIDVEVPILMNYKEAIKQLDKEHIESLEKFKKCLIDLFIKSGISFIEGNLLNEKLPYPLPDNEKVFCFEIYFGRGRLSLLVFLIEDRLIQVVFQSDDPDFEENEWLRGFQKEWLKLDEFFNRFPKIVEFTKWNY